MTLRRLVSTRNVTSYMTNTKIKDLPMNTNFARCLNLAQRPSNGGDYVTEGRAGLQQSAAGALTPAY